MENIHVEPASGPATDDTITTVVGIVIHFDAVGLWTATHILADGTRRLLGGGYPTVGQTRHDARLTFGDHPMVLRRS